MDIIQKKILRNIELSGLNGEHIKSLIDNFSYTATNLEKKYHNFKAENLPIYEKTFSDPTKINNLLNNDYRGEIVTQLTGYVFGIPISYSLDKTQYNDDEFENYYKYLSDIKERNSFVDLDLETGKYMSICGYGVRLLNIDEEGELEILNLEPWECIVLEYNDKTRYALRFYKDFENDKETIKAEFYDSSKIYFFTSEDGNYILKDEKEHTFDFVPIIKFKNNKEEIGDFWKVESLIDGYDRTTSDAQDEIDEHRSAYQIFIGAEIDRETKKEAKQLGGYNMPEGSTVNYLVKNLNDVYMENHKKTLEKNIYKFSNTVDMSDEKFSGGSQSGESRKWKLVSMENKAIEKENKFKKALRYQYKIICNYLKKKKNIDINYLDIFFEFTRNLPVDLSYYADTSQKLSGILSKRTILGHMPIVDDVDYEMNLIEQENNSDIIDYDFFNENDKVNE